MSVRKVLPYQVVQRNQQRGQIQFQGAMGRWHRRRIFFGRTIEEARGKAERDIELPAPWDTETAESWIHPANRHDWPEIQAHD